MFNFSVGFGVEEGVSEEVFRCFLKAVERGHIGRFGEPVFRLLASMSLEEVSPVYFLNQLAYVDMNGGKDEFLAVLSEEACQWIFDARYDILQSYYWNGMGRVESFVVYDMDDIKVGLVYQCFQSVAYELLNDQGQYNGIWKRFLNWMYQFYKSLL